jgi:hypothetical protein
MRKSESGFSHIVLLIIFVATVVAGSGYLVYQHSHSPTVANISTLNRSNNGSLAVPNTSNTVPGVASAINGLATSLNSSESALDNQYVSSDSTSDVNLGTTANNVGGAYDASNY